MPANNRISNQRGFSLIELLIVISIIAILSALLFVSFTQLQKNSRDTQRKSDLQSVASVLQRFYSDNSSFPNSSSGLISYLKGDCTTSGTTQTPAWGIGSIICNGKTYTKQLPKDPTGSREYCYASGGTPPQTYTLYTKLEGQTGALGPCGGFSDYNFAVTSND